MGNIYPNQHSKYQPSFIIHYLRKTKLQLKKEFEITPIRPFNALKLINFHFLFKCCYCILTVYKLNFCSKASEISLRHKNDQKRFWHNTMDIRNKLNVPSMVLQGTFPRLLSKTDCLRFRVIQSHYRLPIHANIYKVWFQHFDMLRQICESTWSSPEFVKKNLFLSDCPARALTSFRWGTSISCKNKLNYGGTSKHMPFPHSAIVSQFFHALNLFRLYAVSIFNIKY